MTLPDHFAENLSRHGDVERAAASLGKSKAWGASMLKKLREQLGEQAV